jgi:hypothetical protein
MGQGYDKPFIQEYLTGALEITSGMIAAAALNQDGLCGLEKEPERIDAPWYRLSRRFVDPPVSRVTYKEQ